jgi:hypothetical protein
MEEGVVAVLRRPWPHSTTLGRIVDISTDGLAFTYVGDEQSLNVSSQLEIMPGDCSSRLREMPFEIISDSQTAPKADFTCLEMRRCSMQFGKLTPTQKRQLDGFIENHSTGELPIESLAHPEF